MPSFDSALRAQCKRVISQEMSQYDRLSRPSRLTYEHAVERAVDNGFPTYSCGHGILFVNVCEKCTRNEDDCQVYRRDAIKRLEELLRVLSQS